MKTLDHFVDEAVVEAPVKRRRRPVVLAVVVALLMGGTALATHALSSSHTVTKTTTVKVPVVEKPKTTLAPTCAPGAAPGSCNVDEEREALIPDQPLSEATHALLASQLTAARTFALQYPTVADATRAGFIPAGKFSPETGAHFVKPELGAFDPSNPGSLIYDGNTPWSKLIGVMYISGNPTAPEGFAGPNDHWHRHRNTCVIFGGPGGIKVPFPADSDVTPSQCDALHGTFMKTTVWMVHAWVVPSYESPLGVFSHNNPDIKCADGTEHVDSVGFCKGPGDVASPS